MKKIALLLTVVLSVLLLLCACKDAPPAVDGPTPPEEEPSVNGFRLSLSLDKTYYIVLDYEGDALELTLPSEYGGIPVRAISFLDWSDKKEDIQRVERLIIPEGIETINFSTFNKNSALTEVSLPNSIRLIDLDNFTNCPSLVYNEYENGYYLGNEENPYLVYIKPKDGTAKAYEVHPDTVMIGSAAFAQNKVIESIGLPQGLKYIGPRAFYATTALKSMTLPASVEKIEGGAFSHSLIESVSIPSGYIGSDCFRACERLREVKLGDGVNRIEAHAFLDCSAIETLVLPKRVELGSCHPLPETIKTLYCKGAESENASVVHWLDGLSDGTEPAVVWNYEE